MSWPLPARGGQDSKSPAPAAPAASADPDSAAAATPSPFEPTVESTVRPEGPAPDGMVWIPGGDFSMGSLDPTTAVCGGHEAMREARPVHRVHVDGFWMDTTEVTNAEFARFVAETHYVTVAEQAPKAEDFPGAPPENLVAGSTVFTPTPAPVSLDDYFQWWRYEHGADWRHPEGPGSGIDDHEKWPVVQIAYADAEAYARWADKRLPTESEWEFAARGGLTGQLYAWGDEFRPGDTYMANTYQGSFPVKDDGADGFAGLAPVGQFPANGYGLRDMSGNVWEWCSDWYRPDAYVLLAAQGPLARNPQGPAKSLDPFEPEQQKRVQRGGSWLCTDQYCTRYMVGTRGRGEVSTASNHLGFRCVRGASP